MVIKTKLHHYWFDTTKSDQKLLYDQMVAQIKSQGTKILRTLPGDLFNHDLYNKQKALVVEDVELDTEYMFSNQWNKRNEKTPEKARRLFDWWEEATFSSNGYETFNIRRGHWLEINSSMMAARLTIFKCSYCGKHYERPHFEFCTNCLGSPHLKESELYLLRLLPIVKLDDEKTPLTVRELNMLLPLFKEAQLKLAAIQIEAKKKRVMNEYNKAVTKRDGYMWLLDRGINTDNVIYYDHTDMFCFGWRKPIGGSLLNDLIKQLENFPFQHEIKYETKEKV